MNEPFQLELLEAICKSCSMCHLSETTEAFGRPIDPHVFSNRQISKFMIIGQNPGYNECIQGEPFVGQSGRNFDTELVKNGLSRSNFYITNTVKCCTPDNRMPTQYEASLCEPFIRMEIGILKPTLLVALGSSAASMLLPNRKFSDIVNDVEISQKFGLPVFSTYHPSPRNMNVPMRKRKFQEGIKLLAGLVASLT